jgi:transcriptional regulator with XRE-family HTH domain
MRLGELVAVARECKGWTLRDLEKASGVSKALISQIETGKIKDPGFTTVVRLVDALGVTLDRAATAERAKLEVLRQSQERSTRKVQKMTLSDPTRTY